MFYSLTERIDDFFGRMNMHGSLVKMLTAFVILIGLLLLGALFYFILKKVIGYLIKNSHRRKPRIWWEALQNNKFTPFISALVPGLIIQKMIPQFFQAGSKIEIFYSSIASIYLIINISLIVMAFLNALAEVLLNKEATKDKPVKSYVQIIMVIVWLISAVLVISIILQKSPSGLLAGIGAFSAVLLLVFQDMIIGFVNSIQLSSNDLLRNGDWITMNKYGVDGDVEEINLISVKVRNFDKTISTIPVKQLVTDSFQNWRAIQELGIRRIKRSINIDVTSIKACTPQMLEKYKKIDLIKDYIESLEREQEEYNANMQTDTSLLPNSRHQTNIGVLRAYILAYLKNNPKISKKGTLMVRQLAPNEYGLPVELYCFTATSEWAPYENIQADIFDHLYSILDYFDIRAFQRDVGKKSSSSDAE